MTFKKIRAVLACAWIGLGIVCAQQETATALPAPTPPFIHLPERAAWVVTLRYGEEKGTKEAPGGKPSEAAAMVRLTRIESRKTGEWKRDVFVWSDGRQEEVWYAGKYRLAPTTDGRDVLVLDSTAMDDGSLPGDLQYSGAAVATGWIAAETYRGVRPCNQISCYYFEGAAGMGSPRAWINVKTRLPVQVQCNGIAYSFEFQSAPSGELTLPAAYREAWKQFEKLEKARRRMQQAAGQ